MLKSGRIIPLSVLLVLAAWPATGQMRTMRTIVNSSPEPKTTITTTTPRTDGQDVTTSTDVAMEPGTREIVTPEGTKITITRTRATGLAPASTTTVTQAADVTTTTTETASETVTEASGPDPCPNQLAKTLYRKLLPTGGDSNKAQCFWQQNGFEMLKNAQMVSSDGSVAAAMDTASDFYRGWRFMFSVAVASKADEEEPAPAAAADEETPAAKPEALSLFQSNGGNLALAASLPLYATLWGDANFDGKNDGHGASGFTAITYLRLAGTFDAFGETNGSPTNLESDKLNANAEWALTTQTNLITVAEVFQFDVYTNTGLVAGTKTFRKGLGVKDADAGAFLRGEFGLTFRVKNLVIGASYNYYTADGIDDGASLTVGFTR